MRIERLIGLAAVVVVTTMCGGSGDVPTAPGAGGNGGTGGSTACTPGAGTVCLTPSNTFNPTSITITKGSSVTWVNGTGVTHNVTFSTAGAPGNVPDFSSGSQTLTFPSAGTFNYNCTIHGQSMSGTVVVQ